MTEQAIPRHPAKFSASILDALRQELVTWVEDHGPVRVLDPFAGVGRIHDLRDAGGVDTVGVEIQPEWAQAHPATVVGDALRLTELFRPGEVTALVTSIVYPNRMTDSHDAKERCSACDGTGCDPATERLATPEEVDAGCELGITWDPCQKCDGKGVRDHRRNTYTHCLREVGAEPAPGSCVTMGWGKPYRDFHEAAVDQWWQVLPPESLVIVNVSNHLQTLYLDGKDKPGVVVEHRVVEWWTNLLLYKGCRLVKARRVSTRRNGQGQNRELRVDGEMLLVVQSPSRRWR